MLWVYDFYVNGENQVKVRSLTVMPISRGTTQNKVGPYFTLYHGIAQL